MKEQIENFTTFLKSKSRAMATIVAYAKDLSQLQDYLQSTGKSNLAEITSEDLNGFLNKLAKENYTAKSISRKINAIKTFFRFCIANNTITENPASSLVHPKIESSRPRILSPLEYRALRDACREDARMAAIVELLLQTGMRIGELAALTVGSINHNIVTIPALESHIERQVDLNKAASAAIEHYLSTRPRVKSAALFITKTGRALLIRNMRTAIDRYFKIAGIKNAKVNDLRHTFIAHHLASGVSPMVVSKMVGHKRLATTEKYLEYIKDLQVDNTKLEEL